MTSVLWVNTPYVKFFAFVVSRCSQYCSLNCWFATGHGWHFLSDSDTGLDQRTSRVHFYNIIFLCTLSGTTSYLLSFGFSRQNPVRIFL